MEHIISFITNQLPTSQSCHQLKPSSTSDLSIDVVNSYFSVIFLLHHLMQTFSRKILLSHDSTCSIFLYVGHSLVGLLELLILALREQTNRAIRAVN